MQGFVVDIEQETLQNELFRRVLYTDTNVQLVIMALKPGEDIGEEVHQLDQFIRVEVGVGTVILNGVSHALKDGTAVVVPKGTRHNVINASPTDPLKLYTLYAPPEHKAGTVHQTKADALAAEQTDHFDGITSE